MRKPVIAGNWKMHKTVAEACEFADQVLPQVEHTTGVEIVICPPFTAIKPLYQVLQGTPVGLGAQNIFWEEKGAFTGEISPIMLKEAGCKYVIIGHSERRQILGETNEIVNKKMQCALRFELCPILCVGETLEERKAGKAEALVQEQLQAGLAGVKDTGFIIAYEPIWAIGTGVNASPQDAQEMSSFIRASLARQLGEQAARQIRVLYGGSVKPANIADFIRQLDIDGALVGGASLEAESLATMVKYTEDTIYGK